MIGSLVGTADSLWRMGYAGTQRRPDVTIMLLREKWLFGHALER